MAGFCRIGFKFDNRGDLRDLDHYKKSRNLQYPRVLRRGTVGRMKIHLFLLVFGLALFVGCGEQTMEMATDQSHMPDETIIEWSIKEALGHGRFFHDYDHDHGDPGHGEADDATAESNKEDFDFSRRTTKSRPVDPASRLEQLTIWNRGLSDVSGLLRLKSVKVLYLVNNNIENLRPLAGLANLEELYLDNNPVADVSVLAGMKQLKVLSLRGTQATNGPGLAQLEAALPQCEIIVN